MAKSNSLPSIKKRKFKKGKKNHDNHSEKIQHSTLKNQQSQHSDTCNLRKKKKIKRHDKSSPSYQNVENTYSPKNHIDSKNKKKKKNKKHKKEKEDLLDGIDINDILEYYNEEEDLSNLPHDEFKTFDVPKTKSDYEKYFKKLINESDILLEIVDSRNVKGTRLNKEIEQKIINSNKKLIIVLNKTDSLAKAAKAKKIEKIDNYDVLYCSNFLREKIKEFRDNLIKLVNKYNINKVEKGEKKKKIKIGIIGYPNMGKKTLVHSIKLSNNTNFYERYITFDDIDSFSINSIPCNIYEKDDTNTILISKVANSIDDITDPYPLVKNLLNYVDKKELTNFYEINFNGKFDDLCKKLGDKFNYNKNMNLVYKHIIRDVIEGNIKFYIE